MDRDAAGAILTVDLNALQANYRILDEASGSATCGAVVKANAYGLGIGPVARALHRAGCRHFFVAHLGEGEALRALLDDVEIQVLHGANAGTEDRFREHRLIPVLNRLAQVDAWRQNGGGPAGLHLDSGLARLGLSGPELETLAAEPDRLAGIELRLISSHLASGETPDAASNPQQRAAFEAKRALLPAAPASLVASSGIFLGPEYHYDAVRVGVALHGVNPTPEQSNPMRQVVTLEAKILTVREIDRGEGVGYGLTWRAPGRRRIATVSMGYADGYIRTLGNVAEAVIQGRRVPVVGRISMDLITLDVTEVADGALEFGAPVEMIGATIGLDELAEAGDTIAYELLTGLGPRLHRAYLGEAGA